jgi:DNA repair protein RecO (recombination protein O)
MKEGEGIIIEIREYGSTSLILKFLTSEGVISGFLKGGVKQKERLSLFSIINFKLNKRLEEHLGVLKLERINSFALCFIKNRTKLFVLSLLQEILLTLFQEESPEEELYALTTNILWFLNEEENEDVIIAEYLKYELNLLSVLGFGLDFTKCALGGKDDIFYISPNTGKCAGFEVAKEIKGKLFEIPFIYGNKNSKYVNVNQDIINAFEVNSHFLKNVNNWEKLKLRLKIPSKLKSNPSF